MARSLRLPEPIEIGPYRAWVDFDFQHPDFSFQLNGLGEMFRGVTGSSSHREDTVLTAVLKVPDGGEKLFAIKSFARQSGFKDWTDRFRGSEAFRAFRAARFLLDGGVRAPVPAAALERWEEGRLVQSYFIAEHITGAVSFKDALVMLYRQHPYSEALVNLLQVVADGVRAMHECGFFHRDLGNQNILLHPAGRFAWKDPVFIDLSRGKCLLEVSTRQRAYDFSRIHLPSDFLRIFKEMYFGERAPRDFQLWETRYRRQFDLHTRSRRFRHPVREARRRVDEDGDKRRYPPLRDIWIWDENSAQAINVVRTAERNRCYPFSNYRKVVGSVLKGIGPVWRDFRETRQDRFKSTVTMKDRVGISVDPSPETWDREFALLQELGRLPVLLRFYHHRSERNLDFRIRAARELLDAGYPVALSLVQDRRAVLNSTSWTRFVYTVLDALGGEADYVQVGHAVNRVKWGVWGYDEYTRLVEPAFRHARQNGPLRLVGPGMIDFEYHQLMGLLCHLPADMKFHALGHLLYVDRRGAPENRQGPVDTADKCALARAIARYTGRAEDRLVITEVNWPISGTGVWSPVGSPYLFPGQLVGHPSVSEKLYGDYMIRYFLQTVCSGMAERVYWWRLVARGYGLVDDTDPQNWRKRTAFGLFRSFLQHMDDAEFSWVEEDEGKWIFHFANDMQGDFTMAYAQEGERLWLNERYGRLTDAGGTTIAGNTKEIVLDATPKYFKDNLELYGKGRSAGIASTQSFRLD